MSRQSTYFTPGGLGRGHQPQFGARLAGGGGQQCLKGGRADRLIPYAQAALRFDMQGDHPLGQGSLQQPLGQQQQAQGKATNR